MIFFEVILPVLLIFLSGYVLQRIFKLDLKPISTLAIYVLTTALVFRTFYKTPLDLQLFYIVIISLLLLAGLIVITQLTARFFKYDKQQESALMLSTAFMNSGNYGASIILFAFGETGFHYAVQIMVFHSIIMGVFGVYFASRGENGARTAVKAVLKQPSNYAVIVAVAMQQFQVVIPESYYQAIDLVAQAAIPTVMLILGMQLANVSSSTFEWQSLSVATVIRLVASPLLAYLICLCFPIDPLLQKVLVILAAMPSAATTAMYAIQFNMRPQFVSSSVLVTTLISVGTLTFLLNIMQ
ncbi:AEC family transporter [Brevibacillus borstelensis]|uniref:AEC family transporter n=1 Tax=Brevibacillus borstelensis TaxID=45462 RepID=UPI001D0B0C54|nr:AEC family transporter [Brevibacillus borstelensis]MCC0562855.1 AEC family transporter [Brevibacillus borstelensis]MCM3470304.1 AEC family transporter [Brevibacillus borstelensis]MCM3557123.1 AEC family transporter [Brevibacillus borstelensis]MCM3621810.1 AEC family transporter [Brevibacillus borstelensis]